MNVLDTIARLLTTTEFGLELHKIRAHPNDFVVAARAADRSAAGFQRGPNGQVLLGSVEVISDPVAARGRPLALVAFRAPIEPPAGKRRRHSWADAGELDRCRHCGIGKRRIPHRYGRGFETEYVLLDGSTATGPVPHCGPCA